MHFLVKFSMIKKRKRIRRKNVFKTIKQNTSSEIIVKKSKFIAHCFSVQTEQEAEEKIKQIRKQYYDAKHHCYAYCILTPNGILSKMSEDGEPSGTAGTPMLTILQKQELVNVLVIVTRYFGGILLGTGGLVKAYSEATLQAIQKTEIVFEQEGYELEIEVDYAEWEKLQYYCRKNKISIEKIDYGETINCKLEVTKEEKEKMLVLKQEGNLKIRKWTVLAEKRIQKNVEK